jgi:hypothetical protein
MQKILWHRTLDFPSRQYELNHNLLQADIQEIFARKSEFVNKEENFKQPLRGQETLLDRGLTIRSSGGSRRASGDRS